MLTDATQRRRPAREFDERGRPRGAPHRLGHRRLHRLETSGHAREPIEVDFVERFGRPLCRACPTGTPRRRLRRDARRVPGAWLADIYHEYGRALLELNVRSFLQATGKVNRGIRDTLRDEPERFLAYNNGISATASEVVVVDLPGGGRGIAASATCRSSTAGRPRPRSIAPAATGVDLAAVAVQAQDHGRRTPSAWRRSSRSSHATPTARTRSARPTSPPTSRSTSRSRTSRGPCGRRRPATRMRQTRWFYERARGQYADALCARAHPPDSRPGRPRTRPTQKFTKTDLAKFENAWDQLPHEVSRGAQKNFTVFMADLRSDPSSRRSAYFERLVAKAILWKRTERLITDPQFGGYRANLVAYAIAKLSHATGQRLDLRASGTRQALDARDWSSARRPLAPRLGRCSSSRRRPGANITEWAKREECWQLMRSMPFASTRR